MRPALTHFVLALHGHLPFLLNHGRSAHRSDWVAEAVVDTYLPLLEALRASGEGGVAMPMTLCITPVLAAQLDSRAFHGELDIFFERRLLACDEASASAAETGDERLAPLARFWRDRLERLRALYHAIDRDLVGALRTLASEGRIELMGSAATHALLPLLARDESVRLQLLLGRDEHRRTFRSDPTGCWLPECGYRGRGRWAPLPDAPGAGTRAGIDRHLVDAGYRYFFVDAHMVGAGRPLGVYADSQTPEEEPERLAAADPPAAPGAPPPAHTPYAPYRVRGHATGAALAVLVRDPRSSRAAWDREAGYPSYAGYLDVHHAHEPEGLHYRRIGGAGSSSDDGAPYDPGDALAQAGRDAAGFAALVASSASGVAEGAAPVVLAPFEAELFGHWWFEGIEFLSALYRALAERTDVRGVTAGAYIGGEGAGSGDAGAEVVEVAAGSWGANGDFGLWLNEATERMWPQLWSLEEAFWGLAPAALAADEARQPLAQAARELVLAQSSDWPFLVTTGAGADYGRRRFDGHREDAERLLATIRSGLDTGDFGAAQHLAAELWVRDHVFPEILAPVEEVLRAGGRGA